jgi:hypothetical protein
LTIVSSPKVQSQWPDVQNAPRPLDRYDAAMPTATCRDTDSINFLIASPKVLTCTEAAAGRPSTPAPSAHDAFIERVGKILGVLLHMVGHDEP